MNFFERRKLKKAVHHMLHVAAHARHMRGDVADPEDLRRLIEAEDALRAAWKAHDSAACDTAAELLDAAVNKVYPPTKDSGWRENVEIFAVALAVAMAFRTYLLQPFEIPTNSMWPTLYGITIDATATQRWCDHFPFNEVTRFVFGERYVQIKAPATGYLEMVGDPNEPRRPLIIPSALSAPTGSALLDHLKPFRLIYHFILGDAPPGDCFVFAIKDQRGPAGRVLAYCPVSKDLLPALGSDGQVFAGQIIASGRVMAGDHIFVDRVSYNLHTPTRGDVFVFSTIDLDYSGVHTNDHYIKRLAGLPNENIRVSPPYLVANDRRITNAPFAKLLVQANNYAGIGYTLPSVADAALAPMRQPLHLSPTQYLPFGDNTEHSLDGRYFGPVEQKRVVGPALFVYWPFGPRWGLIR